MAESGNHAKTIQGHLEPAGYQQITSLNIVKALTVPKYAKLVMIQAESQAVRWRDDGTNPSGTVGMVLAAGDTLVYTGKFAAIKFIEAAASAKLNVTYYK